MIKLAAFLFTFAFVSPLLAQQTSDDAAIREVINQLFAAMQKGDSAMLHGVFTKEVTMASIVRNKNNEPILTRESIKDFLEAVGKPHSGTYYEEIWNLKIDIDGDFAQAWCDYGFFVDNTFSHCGVDALELHKEKNGWKIFHLADTRRKSGCNVPTDIKKKHGQ